MNCIEHVIEHVSVRIRLQPAGCQRKSQIDSQDPNPKSTETDQRSLMNVDDDISRQRSLRGRSLLVRWRNHRRKIQTAHAKIGCHSRPSHEEYSRITISFI